MGVGVVGHLLDGGHRIGIKLQGLAVGKHGTRRQHGDVVEHDVLLMDFDFALLDARLVHHLDMMLDTDSAAAARTTSHRQQDVRKRRRWKGIRLRWRQIAQMLDRIKAGQMKRIVRYRVRRRACEDVHVVRRERMIVIGTRRGVVIRRAGHQGLIVLDAVAGDVLKDPQITCEMRNDFDEAR